MFELVCADVERQLASGESFERIETWIAELHSPEEYKDALWLLAWSEQPFAQRRRIIEPMIVQPSRGAPSSSRIVREQLRA